MNPGAPDRVHSRPATDRRSPAALPERWQAWWDSYELKLLGDFRRPKTLTAYHDSLAQFARFLASDGKAPDLAETTPEECPPLDALAQ